MSNILLSVLKNGFSKELTRFRHHCTSTLGKTLVGRFGMDPESSRPENSMNANSALDVTRNMSQSDPAHPNADEYTPSQDGRTAPNRGGMAAACSNAKEDERFADISTSFAAMRSSDMEEDESNPLRKGKASIPLFSPISTGTSVRIVNTNVSKLQKPQASLFSPLSVQLRQISNDFTNESQGETMAVGQSTGFSIPKEETDQISPLSIKEDTQDIGLKARVRKKPENGSRQNTKYQLTSDRNAQGRLHRVSVLISTKVRNGFVSCRQVTMRIYQSTSRQLTTIRYYITSLTILSIMITACFFRYVFNLPVRFIAYVRQQIPKRTGIRDIQEFQDNETCIATEQNRGPKESCEENDHEANAADSNETSILSGSERVSQSVVEADATHIQNESAQKENEMFTIEDAEKAAGINVETGSESDCFDQRIPSSSEQKSSGTSQSNGPRGDRMTESVDTTKIAIEEKNMEILMSPMRQTKSPFLDSTHESDGSDIGQDVNRYESSSSAYTSHEGSDKSGRLESRRKLGSGFRVLSDVKSVKGSIKRALNRGKMEPETRFASPRSARKTMTIIADLLVKEYLCDVAVRKVGSLKLRAEKTMASGHALRIRVCFQELDAYSCNVMISRSKEDDIEVSTYEYVNFIADLQRSFSDMVTPERK